jgi:tetratricopeptide (TPR) repeat protein
MLDVRMACLDDKRRHVDALLAELVEIALRQPPPKTGERGRTYDHLADELEAVNVARDFGRYDDGLDRARRAMPRVDALGYKSLQARFRYIEGELYDLTGEPDRATAALEDSLVLAEASRDQEVKVVTLIRLYMIAGARDDVAAADRWSRLAEAALEASSGDPQQKAYLLLAQGNVAYRRDDYATAAARFEQGLAIARQDPQSTLELGFITNLGTVYYMQERDADARRLWDQALARAIAQYGPNHPTVGTLYNNVAMFEADTGDPRAALGNFQRALEIAEHGRAGDRGAIGRIHVRIAEVLATLGSNAEAGQRYATGVALLEAAYAKGDPSLTAAMLSYGIFASDTRDFHTALAVYQRALAIDEAAHGVGDPSLYPLVHGLGAARLELGDTDAAIAILRRALDLVARAPDATLLARALVERDLARALAPSRPAEARVLAATALLRLATARGDNRANIAEVRAQLAALAR